jgi:hypothetical protein
LPNIYVQVEEKVTTISILEGKLRIYAQECDMLGAQLENSRSQVGSASPNQLIKPNHESVVSWLTNRRRCSVYKKLFGWLQIRIALFRPVKSITMHR